MNTVFNLCKLLIDRGRTDGLQDKMDVYLAADRLTPEEYQELAGLLAPEQKSTAGSLDKRMRIK